MNDSNDSPQVPSARADLLSALAWIVFGLAIVIGAWRMDRLTEQGATLYSAPGLVPGLLGAMLVVLGSLLGWRALRSNAVAQLAHNWKLTKEGREAAIRVGIALVLMLTYAVGLVSRTPFWLATLLFVLVFVLLFAAKDRRQGWRGIVTALIIAAATAAVIDIVFEDVFLVRLP